MTDWLNADSRTFLSRGYLSPGQSAEQRIAQIAHTAATTLNILGFYNKFQQYMLNGWISLSSPVWANFGTDRGLPISCNNSYFEDTIESILTKTAEIGMQTKYGAGTSAYLGKLRHRGSPISVGGVSFGPIHFMELLETTTNIISQSEIRRGSCAVYLDIEHKDILEFLDCRETENSIQHLSLGICITDSWMEDMLAGNADKRKIWARILRKRFESGYPYLFFTDTVNNNAPEVYKDLGRKIYSSNLCSEIALSSNEDESFVCNLASLNLLKWDEWKDTDIVEILVLFLDAVMSEYIEKTENIPLMRTAYNFAKHQRALGIGTLGWHSYLQSNQISFSSFRAKNLNVTIHKNIAEKALQASKDMISRYGFEEPEMLKNYGRRNVTLMAVAPTTSSSFILGQVSPSIEPLDSNYFVKDLQKGKFTYHNPYLTNLLEEKNTNNAKTWDNILIHGGSVQKLDILNEEEKEVFKTFDELSQWEIIVQAAGRQKYIDQSQSLNLKIHPNAAMKDINKLIIEGWKLGIKTFYYQRSTNLAQEFIRDTLACASCEA